MRVPNPFLLNATPPGGVAIIVTADPGGLNGYTLTGQAGPPLTVTINGEPAAYPATLTTDDVLLFERTDSSAGLSVIFAFAPVGDAPLGMDYTVTQDADGYQLINDTDATADAEGYETIPDAVAIPDLDGYEAVERSTP